MKKCLTIVTFLCCFKYGSCQTFQEWFNQKKTQIEYLLQQIAANQIYIEYLQKGYKIAQSGLETINKIKKGDFDLHNTFFSSLDSVNPKIRQSRKVIDVITFQLQIIKEIKKAMDGAKGSNQFTMQEIDYLQNVFDTLLGECLKDIEELTEIISTDKLKMTDNERLERLDEIYSSTLDKLSFTKSFSSEAAVLAEERLMEQSDILVTKKLNGL